MIQFAADPLEQTTAATDVLLGLLALWSLWRVRGFGQAAPWRRLVWSLALGFLALGALIGAAAHGFEMNLATNDLLWMPIYLSLGLAVGMFGVGAITDLRGEPAGRRTPPFFAGAAVLFFVLTQVFDAGFLMFILFEGIVMLFALLGYVRLWRQGVLSGAGWMALAVFVTILAAVIQATRIIPGFTFVWTFDHNGVFHLVQMAGILLLAAGLRRTLRRTPA